MKRRYFEDKIDILREELESWLNTPYKHFSGVKNKGTDCIHYIVNVLNATGANQGKNLVIPFYHKDWHLHRGEELLKTQIEEKLYSEKIAWREENGTLKCSETVGNGDLILFKFGRLSGHCGMFCGNQVYQSLNYSGVEKISFHNSNFLKRITDIYKIYKV